MAKKAAAKDVFFLFRCWFVARLRLLSASAVSLITKAKEGRKVCARAVVSDIVVVVG